MNDSSNPLTASELSALVSMQLGVWDVDLSTGVITSNPRCRALIGLPPDQEITIDSWKASVHRDDLTRVLATVEQALSQTLTEPFSAEYRCVAADGQERWLCATAHLQPRSSLSQGMRVVGTLWDVTARVVAERQLAESETRFKQLVENISDVFWIVDPVAGKHLFVSAAYQQLWGLDPEALLKGRPRWPEYIHPDDRERVDALFAAIDHSGQFETEYRMLLPDGSLRWVRDRGAAVRDGDGRAIRVIGIAEDITERRQAQATLALQEQRLELALRAAGLHVWSFDPSRRHFDANALLCQLFGLDPERCKRLGPWRRQLHIDDRARFESAFRATLLRGEPLNEDFSVTLANGERRRFNAQAMRIGRGRNARLYGVCADITSRAAQEDALKDRNLRLKLALDAAQMSIWSLDIASLKLEVGPDFRRILAMPESMPVTTTSLYEYIVVDDRAGVQAAFEEAMANRTGFNVDYRVQVAGKAVRWINSQATLLFDESGTATRANGVVVDITQRKLAEQRLRNNEQQLRFITDAVPVGIVRCSADLRYLWVNRAYAERLHRRTPEDLAGQAIIDTIGEAAAEVLQPHIERVLSGHRVEFEAAVPLKKAGEHTLLAHYVPEFADDGSVGGFVGVIQDVSERTRAEAERTLLLAAELEARQQAEAAARARDQFLAIVSHELRSPLSGIQSWTQVLDSQLQQGPPLVRRALDGIKTGVTQQVRLIDDLLDATRIMSGKLSLVKQPVVVRTAIKAALLSIQAAASAKQINLTSRLRVGDATVDGDPDRLQQIVWNLLSNAVKFTPANGAVSVCAVADSTQVTITVGDNGKGISADFMPDLFEWFKRAETSSYRGQDGLGLGLALVRHLCDLHAGKVSAESEGEGMGARFTVVLPRSGSAPDLPLPIDSVAQHRQALSRVRIVLIDDQAASREAIAVLLRQAEAEVLEFSSGPEARAGLSTSDVWPDVLLCDIAMPEEDGYRCLMRLRDMEAAPSSVYRKPMLAIALTAFAQHEDRLRAMEAGFDEHLTKPVSAVDLIDTIIALSQAARPDRTN